jgi:predicted DNA-binding transcriptional regulator AlpA
VAPTDVPALPGDLMTFTEIRERLGVGKSRAHSISTHFAFPRPWFVDRDGRIRLWRRAEVDAWFDANRPGWRDTPPVGH